MQTQPNNVVQFARRAERSEYAANAALRDTDHAPAPTPSAATLWAKRRARERRLQKRAALWVRVLMAVGTLLIVATLYPPPA